MRLAEFILYFVLSVLGFFAARVVVRDSWTNATKIAFRLIAGATVTLLLAFAYVLTNERLEDRLARLIFCPWYEFEACKAAKRAGAPLPEVGRTNYDDAPRPPKPGGPPSGTTATPDRRFERECDRLAASPEDPRRPPDIEGVKSLSIDGIRARHACAEAWRLQPGVSRFAFQAGRAAFAQGDHRRARDLYQQAANMGHELAMFNLGVLYSSGKGVDQDYVRARQWFERAAALGATRALNEIGLIYANGRGVSRDFGQALQLFERAARLGEAHAMTNLALLYCSGQGAAKNPAEARKWFERAAALGETSAKDKLRTSNDICQPTSTRS